MLDTTDKIILRNLQRNSKKTIKELANKLGLTTSPVFERIKHLEKNGIIKRYVALADHKKIEMGQIVFCNLTMPNYYPKEIQDFEKEISKMPEILECYHFAGIIDFQMKVFVKDIDSYNKFLQRLTKLTMVKVHSSVVVLKAIKYSTEIPL